MLKLTNIDKSATHSVAEIKDSYRFNLLVNGDFQINQRGASSYRNGGYTVDMWRTSATQNLLQPVAGGSL